MTFDAIAFYHQLMMAQGVKDFPLVPNTLDNALKDEKSRIVVTTARVRLPYLFCFVFSAVVGIYQREVSTA